MAPLSQQFNRSSEESVSEAEMENIHLSLNFLKHLGMFENNGHTKITLLERNIKFYQWSYVKNSSDMMNACVLLEFTTSSKIEL